MRTLFLSYYGSDKELSISKYLSQDDSSATDCYVSFALLPISGVDVQIAFFFKAGLVDRHLLRKPKRESFDYDVLV